MSSAERHPTPKSARAVGVVGTGPTACALCCHLVSLGHRVRLFVHDRARIGWLERTAGTFVATGAMEGTFTIEGWGDDPEAFASSVDTIFFGTKVPAYPGVARALAPFLRSSHRIVLFSSKLCGSVHVSQVLAEAGAPAVPVLETDALFACRIRDDDSLFVLGVKRWTLLSGPTRTATREHGHLLLSYFPGLGLADNVIQRGLTDFGAFSHVTIMVANMNRISRGEHFLFYYEALTEQTIAVLERVESEMRAVAEAYGTSLIPMRTLLDRYYGCDATTLLSAMGSVPPYRHAVAPTSLSHRFLREDISCTVALLRELAALAGVPTPTIDAVTHLACVVLGEDLQAGGRDLAALGWAGLDVGEIVERIRA